MQWTEQTRYIANVYFNGDVHRVVVERFDEDDDFALNVNGEYICDVADVPTEEEVMGILDDKVTLDNMATTSYEITGGIDE